SVPPGWEYSVTCESSQAGFSALAQKLTVSPGETIDLGEFDVTKKDRPEPKRTLPSGATGSASAILPLPRGEGRGEGTAKATDSNSKEPTGKASATQAASSTPDHDLLTIRGRVLDPAGKPVAADILVLPWFAWYIPSADRLPIAASKSDAAGNFQIQFS